MEQKFQKLLPIFKGIKYTNNEAYFDCIEEVDAIIDKNGSTIMCEIQGYV